MNKKKIYIIVSQGIKIAEFYNKEVAEAIVKRENEKFYKYQQECIDKGEPYTDTELHLYEDEITSRNCKSCIYYDKLLDICFYTPEWRTVWDEEEACEHWQELPD